MTKEVGSPSFPEKGHIDCKRTDILFELFEGKYRTRSGDIFGHSCEIPACDSAQDRITKVREQNKALRAEEKAAVGSGKRQRRRERDIPE
jgi:hypothetical protein